MNRVKLVTLVALSIASFASSAAAQSAPAKDDIVVGAEPEKVGAEPEKAPPPANDVEPGPSEPVAVQVSPAPTTRPIFVKRQYRGDIAIGDAIGISGAFAFDAAFYTTHQTNGVLFAIPLAGYMLGAPIAHLAHGRPDRAGLSFLFRTTALAGGLAGTAGAANSLCASGGETSSNCALNVILVGALVTTAMVFVAAAIDYEFMADEQVPAAKSGLNVGFDVTGLRATF